MRYLLVILSIWSSLVFAQEALDVKFLSTQRTTGSPFSLPISVNSQGEISLFGENESKLLSFNPVILVGYSSAKIEYSQPVIINRFNFYPLQKHLGWIEVRRQRIEVGAGLAAVMKNTFNLGLSPYRGSIHTLVTHKSDQMEKSLRFKMPKKLSDLESWHEGDFGTFQTYGGIQVYARIGFSVVDALTASFGIQNQFLVEMTKISNSKVKLSLAEENLHRRQLVLGPFFINQVGAEFEGKRLIYEFTLDLTNNEHHELFKEGLDGNIKLLQERLPEHDQKLTWEGKDSSFFFGIPGLIGKQKMQGHYDLNENGEEAELDISGKSNKGYFLPLKNINNYVYRNDQSMVIVWTSEMNKATVKSIRESFFSKGQILNVRGFHREIPTDQKFGSVVSQFGVNFTQSEIERLKSADQLAFQNHLLKRCQEESLACQKDKKLKKIMKSLKKLLARPWEDMEGGLGKFLTKEPAVIYAIVKTLNLKKEVYFKFLSEKYQSLEGTSLIEI